MAEWEITVSYSELQSMRRCLFKHHLEYRLGYTRDHSPTSALGFGTAWHEVLNAYYSTLRDTTTWDYARSPWRSGKAVIEEQDEEIQDDLRWMLDGYSACYGLEDGWKVKAVEQTLITPLPQLSPDFRINLKAKIDLAIVDRAGNTWIDDHKTCARLPAANSFRDPQLPLYLYSWNRHYTSGYGARYSHALKPGKRTRPNEFEKRFRRTLITYSEREIQQIAQDAYMTAYLAYSSPHYTPRSLSPDCSWCDFKDACRLSLRGRPVETALKDYGFSQWRDEPKRPTEYQGKEAA